MKFRLIEGGLSVDSDTQAIDKLTKRIEAITQAIELFNESDWQMDEVANWLEYEKELALIQSKLYTQQQEQQ
jgi:hypothetical protein